MENIYGISKARTYSYFMITCITSPISGAILSGYISKRVGGYESQRIIPIALITGIIAICSVIPFPWVEDYRIGVLIIWIVLFCGAFILPIMNGVLLCVVEPELKEHAQSIANICYNLLGYLPAPTIYGAMNRLDPKGENQSRYGMALILYIVITAVACLAVIYMIRKTEAA